MRLLRGNLKFFGFHDPNNRLESSHQAARAMLIRDDQDDTSRESLEK